MGNAVIRGLPAPKLLGRFSKHFARLITTGTPPHMQVLGPISSKGACLRMREIVTLGRLFFSFLAFMRIATYRPVSVGPIVAVTGSNNAPWWHSRRFYGFDNKNLFFPIFHQKCRKIAL